MVTPRRNRAQAVSTHPLHEAPCSVLVARGVDGERWPRRIVVGRVARFRARTRRGTSSRGRFDAELHASAATEDIDLAAARRLAPELEEHDGRALDVLTAAAETSDLLVVGESRGARQPQRAARARCRTVLVVRTRAAQAVTWVSRR